MLMSTITRSGGLISPESGDLLKSFLPACRFADFMTRPLGGIDQGAQEAAGRGTVVDEKDVHRAKSLDYFLSFPPNKEPSRERKGISAGGPF